jgi:hypothetical protein
METIKIVNATTGEEIEREMNDEELAQLAKDEKAFAKRQAESEAKESARAAILDRLGLTAEEAALLLG